MRVYHVLTDTAYRLLVCTQILLRQQFHRFDEKHEMKLNLTVR